MRLGMRFTLVPLLVAACSRGERALPPGGPGADEYAVWSAAVDALFADHYRLVVVDEHTFSLVTDTPYERKSLREGAGLPRALVDGYFASNGHSVAVDPRRLHTRRVRLLPAGRVTGALAGAASDGKLTLSRVGFDRGGKRALVTVTVTCGALCGDGAMLVLERGRDGAWRRTSEPMTINF